MSKWAVRERGNFSLGSNLACQSLSTCNHKYDTTETLVPQPCGVGLLNLHRIQSCPTNAKIANRRTFVRFGRIILVTLAPLLGLSAVSAAMIAAMASGPAVSNEHKSNSLTRLLLSVVTPMDETSALNVRADRPSPQAVLPVIALADTPLRHSVWMVASQTVVPFSPRSQHRSQLRC